MDSNLALGIDITITRQALGGPGDRQLSEAVTDAVVMVTFQGIEVTRKFNFKASNVKDARSIATQKMIGWVNSVILSGASNVFILERIVLSSKPDDTTSCMARFATGSRDILPFDVHVPGADDVDQGYSESIHLLTVMFESLQARLKSLVVP